MSGPLEIVGEPDAPSCADGVCEVPAADEEASPAGPPPVRP
ncbi:hypothetical protein [Aeromicrobium sp. CFBP 8757]|nr:hypothetical protein [Aeromicrobium sp. CFBP 8757]